MATSGDALFFSSSIFGGEKEEVRPHGWSFSQAGRCGQSSSGRLCSSVGAVIENYQQQQQQQQSHHGCPGFFVIFCQSSIRNTPSVLFFGPTRIPSAGWLLLGLCLFMYIICYLWEQTMCWFSTSNYLWRTWGCVPASPLWLRHQSLAELSASPPGGSCWYVIVESISLHVFLNSKSDLRESDWSTLRGSNRCFQRARCQG